MTLKEKTGHKSKYISLLIFIAIFVSEDVMIFGTMKSNYISSVRYIVQIMTTFLIFFYCLKKGKSLNKNSLTVFIQFSFFIVITMFVNHDFRFGYFFTILIYALCVLALWAVSIEKIFEILFKCVTVICSVSLIMFASWYIYPSILRMLPVIENTAGLKLFSVGISNIPVSSGGFLRNYGAFREPGVFQMFIIVSLMYGTFSSQKVKAKHLIIQIIALITTYSTTGYISLGFYVLAVLFQKNKSQRVLKNNGLRYAVLVFICVAMIYLVFGTDVLYSDGYGSVFGKLFNKSASAGARNASIEINLDMFKKSPIFGNGISYVDNYFSILSYQKYKIAFRDNTNTLLIQLARYGIIFWVIYVTRYYKFFVSYFKTGKLSTLCLILSFACLFVGQNLGYSFLFSLPMFYEPERDVKSGEEEHFKYKSW